MPEGSVRAGLVLMGVPALTVRGSTNPSIEG
jgi:hypothetical protein